MKKNLILNAKLIISIYVILTIIKLFTARVDLQRPECPTYVLKIYPTLRNVFYPEDMHVAYYNSKYKWYKNEQFLEVFRSHSNRLVMDIYDALIFLWCAVSIVLIVFAIYTLLGGIKFIRSL